MSTNDTIDSSGYPLAFKTRAGSAQSPVLAGAAGRDVFVSEVRSLTGYQKEAVVTEGAGGNAWRLTTDEGKHIKGTDLAPFPLGFFNAGLHGDLIKRILLIAKARGLALADVQLGLKNFYFLDGSFVRGDGVGGAEPAQIVAKIQSDAPAADMSALVADAVRASPAVAAMRQAVRNTFAIYVNGRRHPVTTLGNSPAPDAPDPYRTYAQPPAPLSGANDLPDLICKTGQVQAGDIVDVSDGAIRRVVRTVAGDSKLLDPAGLTEIKTWLEVAGLSHFAYKTDERDIADPGQQVAPSGLALVAAGIVFCYITQLTRYILHQKVDVGGVRIVQYTPFVTEGSPADGTWSGSIEPVDTHLFLNGGADPATHERIMTIAANTCYLHATLAAALDPIVTVELNGQPLSPPGESAAADD